MNRPRAVFACALVAGLAFVVLIYAHFGPANGPSYMRWPWYRLPHNGRAVALLLLAGSPALIAQFVRRRAAAVAMLVITPALLQWAGIELAPTADNGMQRAEAILVNANTTSYFTAAYRVIDDSGWLRHFDKVMTSVPMHAQTKPPGPIAFCVLLIRVFGTIAAPMAAAIAILMFGCASVAVTYFGCRAIAAEDSAFHAATIVALVPSMVGWYPVIDWLYPVFSVAAIALWHLALTRRSPRAAIAFGLVVFAMSFWTYSLLVLGAPCLIMLIVYRASWRVVASAVAAIVISYAVLWLTLHFDPIGAFRTAVANQKGIMKMMDAFWIPEGKQRTWPRTVPGDLQEFAMGVSWVACVIAIGSAMRNRFSPTVWAMFATPFIVALIGLLPAETSRVWIFLIPFVALPAAIEIAQWTRRRRVVTHALLLACAIAVYANIFFIVI